MDKNSKKTFSILEIDKEIIYLEEMAKNGSILVSVNEDGHVFEEREPQDVSVVIEYWIDKPESSYFYEIQGLSLVASYKGSKGYWNYFMGPRNENINKRKDNYSDYIVMLSKRYEIFWTVIPMTVAIFAIYMYINTNNPIFFLLVIAPIIIFIYLKDIKKKIDDKKKL